MALHFRNEKRAGRAGKMGRRIEPAGALLQ
jgi:hypothetical protein